MSLHCKQQSDSNEHRVFCAILNDWIERGGGVGMCEGVRAGVKRDIEKRVGNVKCMLCGNRECYY